MLFDGIYKLTTQKYFGHQLGPWASLPSAVGINPDRMAPAFVLLGCLWLSSGIALLVNLQWSRPLLSVWDSVSLAYLPFGTVLSLLILTLMFPASVYRRVSATSKETEHSTYRLP